MKTTRVEIHCDNCGKHIPETEKSYVMTERISIYYEKTSQIRFAERVFKVDNGEYCSLSCLFEYITKTLTNPED